MGVRKANTALNTATSLKLPILESVDQHSAILHPLLKLKIRLLLVDDNAQVVTQFILMKDSARKSLSKHQLITGVLKETTAHQVIPGQQITLAEQLKGQNTLPSTYTLFLSG